jgi:hypothetical protein
MRDKNNIKPLVKPLGMLIIDILTGWWDQGDFKKHEARMELLKLNPYRFNTEEWSDYIVWVENLLSLTEKGLLA